jgi:hypothetical protein
MHLHLQFYPVESNSYMLNIRIKFFACITGMQIFDPAWHAWLCHAFRDYIVNGEISVLNICFDCVFWFSLQHLSENFEELNEIP